MLKSEREYEMFIKNLIMVMKKGKSSRTKLNGKIYFKYVFYVRFPSIEVMNYKVIIIKQNSEDTIVI